MGLLLHHCINHWFPPVAHEINVAEQTRIILGLKLNTVSGAGTETRELLEKRIHLLSPARLLPAKAGVEVKRYQGTR